VWYSAPLRRGEHGDSTHSVAAIKVHPRIPAHDPRPASSQFLGEAYPIRRFRPGLAFKLVVPLTVGMFAVLAAHFVTTIQREQVLFETTKQQYGRLIGNSLAQRLADTWAVSGGAPANVLQQELDELGEHVSVSWIPSDATASGGAMAELTTLQRMTLERGDPITIVRRQGSNESLHTYVAVPPPGNGIVAVIDAFSDRDFYVQASVRRFLISLALIVALNALLALALSSWLVSRPFAKLIVKARQVGSGNLSVPVRLERRDEIGELGREMDRMSQNLLEADSKVRAEEAARGKAEEELQHAERLATIGKLAAGVAHELGTPLNVISGRAKRLGRQHGDDTELQGNVAIIREQVDRVTQIIRQLLQLARRRKVSKNWVDLQELTRSTVAEVRPTVSPDICFALNLEETGDTRAQIDGRQIQQVLTNLIINGAQAMPAGGQLSVRLSRCRAIPPAGHSAANGDFLCISVEDKGQGITPEDLPHIFEPFFTTKEVGDGTGLGLAVSLGIVEDHGGWIDVETEVAEGTRFTVYLPGEHC
jgi:two-component system NtrC family sensor kinase